MQTFLGRVRDFCLEKKRLPQLILLVAVVALLAAIPGIYKIIPGTIFRVFIILFILSGAVASGVFLLVKFIKLNKNGEHFYFVRLVISLSILCIFIFILSYINGEQSMQATMADAKVYPVKATGWFDYANIINAIAFSVSSQILLCAFRNVYSKNKSYLEKMIKSIMFAGVPLLILALIIIPISGFGVIFSVFLTIFLWVVAFVLNEIVNDGD